MSTQILSQLDLLSVVVAVAIVLFAAKLRAANTQPATVAIPVKVRED